MPWLALPRSSQYATIAFPSEAGALPATLIKSKRRANDLKMLCSRDFRTFPHISALFPPWGSAWPWHSATFLATNDDSFGSRTSVGRHGRRGAADVVSVRHARDAGFGGLGNGPRWTITRIADTLIAALRWAAAAAVVLRALSRGHA
jgi:hypothetical protein